MKRFKQLILLLFLASLSLMMGFKKHLTGKMTEPKWSGTVKFHQKRTGRTIVRDEWWMIASIINNFGNGLDSSIFQSTEGDRAAAPPMLRQNCRLVWMSKAATMTSPYRFRGAMV
jgi:hypothetical protein